MITPFTSSKFRFHAFLAMVLLVFVHGYNLNDTYLQPFSLVQEELTFTSFFEYFTANALFRFRIPMLFAISGYLFALNDHKPFGERIGKRARTLLLPYFLWSGLALLLTFVLQQFPVTAAAVQTAAVDQMGDNRLYSEMRWYELLTRWTLAPPAFQLWFIRSLFVYNLMYPWLLAGITQQPKIWFPVFALLWLLPVGLFVIDGTGLLFFTLGIWLAKSGNTLEQAPRRLQPIPAAALFVTLCVLKTLLAFHLKNNTTTYIWMTLLHKAIMLSGLIAVWYGADAVVRWWMQRPRLSKLTAFSFIIYALHVPLMNYGYALVKPYVSTLPFYRLTMYFIWPTVIVLFCIGTGALLRRFIPKVYGILTGGRGL